MSQTPRKGRKLRLAVFVGLLGLICIAIVLAALHKTPWTIPPEAKMRINPLAYSAANITAAKQVYSDRCANCHGDSGKGDGSDAMMYDPTPSDLTDATKMSKVTDGEIYYQISEGRKPMPSFKKKLSEEQRWQLVLLVRSFAGQPGGPPPAKQTDVLGNKQPQPPGSPK